MFGDGVLFEFNPNNGTNNKVFDFDSNNLTGKNPYGGLLELSFNSVGIKNIVKNNQIQIYPNPNKGIFRVVFDDGFSGNLLKIFDVSGKLVLEKSIKSPQNSIDIDISDYENGVYVIVINTTNGSIVRKIIKNPL